MDGMASKRLRSLPLHHRKKCQNHQERIEPASAKKLSFATTACWSAVQERALVNYMMDKGFVASFWENAAK